MRTHSNRELWTAHRCVRMFQLSHSKLVDMLRANGISESKIGRRVAFDSAGVARLAGYEPGAFVLPLLKRAQAARLLGINRFAATKLLRSVALYQDKKTRYRVEDVRRAGIRKAVDQDPFVRPVPPQALPPSGIQLARAIIGEFKDCLGKIQDLLGSFETAAGAPEASMAPKLAALPNLAGDQPGPKAYDPILTSRTYETPNLPMRLPAVVLARKVSRECRSVAEKISLHRQLLVSWGQRFLLAPEYVVRFENGQVRHVDPSTLDALASEVAEVVVRGTLATPFSRRAHGKWIAFESVRLGVAGQAVMNAGCLFRAFYAKDSPLFVHAAALLAKVAEGKLSLRTAYGKMRRHERERTGKGRSPRRFRILKAAKSASHR